MTDLPDLDPPMPCLSVVMPCYNEISTIDEVVGQAPLVGERGALRRSRRQRRGRRGDGCGGAANAGAKGNMSAPAIAAARKTDE
mgnify:CR=1 FL=1